MKRILLIFVVLSALKGCAALDCPDRDRDGGIGGTGTCEPSGEETRTVAVITRAG